MLESIQNTAGILAVILVIVWVSVELALYLERRRSRKQARREALDRALARMDKATANALANKALADGVDSGNLRKYFKSDAEAKEFKDWVMGCDKNGFPDSGYTCPGCDYCTGEYGDLDSDILEEKECPCLIPCGHPIGEHGFEITLEGEKTGRVFCKLCIDESNARKN